MAAKMTAEVIPAVRAAVQRIKAGDMCVKDHMEIYPCDNPAQPGGMAGAPTPKTYRAALVIGLLGDRSFLDSAARGMQWVNERLPNVETRIIENADIGEQQLAARAMAEEGYDLVITIGFASVDWTTEIANEYPDTHFAVVQGIGLDVPNGTGLLFHDHEGCFTVGMAAAMLNKTGKVGFIGGMDVPTLRRFEEGFIQGVKYANPDVDVVTGWVGGWGDPTKGKELALTQFQEGVDIIFVAAGKSGEGVLAAAGEQDKFAIGVDSDQCYIEPGNVICSMLKRVDQSVYDAVESLTKGTLEAGDRYYELSNAGTGMCYLYDVDTYFVDNGPPDMVAKFQNEVIPAVKVAAQKIAAGEMCVMDHMELKPCDNPALPGGLSGQPKVFKVALVTPLLGDRGYLDSIALGMQWVEERLSNVDTKIIENADLGEQQLAARAMAEEGYDLIFTVGFDSADWTTEVASEYPDTHFVLVDAVLDVPNGTGLTWKEHDGSFGVGILAAMLTKTGKVGFISGMDVPALRRWELGYIEGVKYANPSVEVVSGWVGAWNDPNKGKELALTQYAEGVDIIFAPAGKSSEGVFQAAVEADLFAVGAGLDHCETWPGHVIASMLKRAESAVFQATKDFTEGKLEAGLRAHGVGENAVGICYLYDIDTAFLDHGPADMVDTFTNKVLPAVRTANEQIKSGAMCVSDYMEVYPCDNPPQPGAMPGAPTVSDKTYRVALVCGLLGDQTFVDNIALGVRTAQEQLPNVETKIIENADIGEQQLAARAMAEEGYDMVITVGFGSVDWTTEIANEYPDTHFTLIDALLDVRNGTGVIFKSHEQCFTVGMVAALMTESDKIGFIGGMDNPNLRNFQEGYWQGAYYVNPDIEIFNGWVGSWSDANKAKELALTQFQDGADIIFAAAGGAGHGVHEAAADQGLFSIGVGMDQCGVQPGSVMCSALKNVNVGTFDAIKLMSEGKLTGGNLAYGMDEDAVGLCWLYDTDTIFVDNGPEYMVKKVPDVLAKVQEAVAKYKAGEFCIHDYTEVWPCDNPVQPGAMSQ
jgi:basic membrane protein A